MLFVAGGLFAAASTSAKARPLRATLIGAGILVGGTIAAFALSSNLLSLAAVVTAVAVTVTPATDGEAREAN